MKLFPNFTRHSSPFDTELRWFSRALRQPETRREISSEAIDKFKAMMWDNPSDDMLPSYGNFFLFIKIKK